MLDVAAAPKSLPIMQRSRNREGRSEHALPPAPLHELVGDLVAGAEGAVRLDESQIAWLADRTEFGTVRVGDETVVQQIGQPADSTAVELGKGVKAALEVLS